MTIAGDWDLTAYFPEFDGETYCAFRGDLARDVATTQNEASALGRVDEASVEAWASLLARLEDISTRAAHLGGYLGCLGAANAKHEGIRRETASAAAARAELHKIVVWAKAALRDIDEALFERLADHPKLEGTRYFLERLRRDASLRMEPELEELTTELEITGFGAWGRLYDQLTGSLEFDLRVAGREARRVPVSMTRSLLEDPDPDVRRAALLGSNHAWESVGEVTAACLNALAGTRHTLYRRRGVEHFLDPALFDAGISRRTLDTLLGVVRERQSIPRRFLRRKAAILGKPRLGFQDLMAPLPLSDQATIPWQEARERVLAAFQSFYPELARFATEAFEGRWIDHAPRAGKRPGGFCSSSVAIEQSRVFITYNETLGDLSTLAHELGHAFHSRVMCGMRPWARRYPMTLAETASTFAEQLMIDAVLENEEASDAERAVVLDRRMQDAATFLLNIPMRFDFEKAFYEERQSGEVGVDRLKELMCGAQRENYSDSLAEADLDPWFWASKLHFYITGISFYNFPYTFGYLFSMGIFARAKREGADFLPRYEELLRWTGCDTAERVAHRCLGVDLGQPDFWHASIDLIEGDAARFEEVAAVLWPDSAIS